MDGDYECQHAIRNTQSLEQDPQNRSVDLVVRLGEVDEALEKCKPFLLRIAGDGSRDPDGVDGGSICTESVLFLW